MSVTALRRLSLAALLCTCSTVVMAQYVWKDGNGTRQYSDRPPPSSVPKERILKAPGRVMNAITNEASPSGSASEAAATTAEPTPAAPPSTAEREADFQKRRAEAAEKKQKDDEQAKQEAERKKNCEKLTAYGRALTSGERIRSTTATGERAYLDDAERAREIRENQQRTREACS